MSDILIRKVTKKEKYSNTHMRRAFISFPEAPAGMETVYKPYGNCGAGFYYVKAQTLKEKWG